MTHSTPVLGIGNAIVDIVASVEEPLLAELELEKGAMTLVDEARSDALYARMPAGREVSGGSCANTMAAIAAMGGNALYIGRVRNDQFGKVFTHDIRAAGVRFESNPSDQGPATARCLVMVTPDAQRTMQTYLGACVELGPEDVTPEMVQAAGITYLEGYLWDRPEAKAACRKAADLCHEAGGRLALTLSDAFCVDRWRDEFRRLIEDEVDILFANRSEILSLYQVSDFDQAVAQLPDHVDIAAITRGDEGSIVIRGQETHRIDAAAPETILDTTGAGDLYAAGFLYGLAANMNLEACGRLGSHAAGVIIGQIGARASQPLAGLPAQFA